MKKQLDDQLKIKFTKENTMTTKTKFTGQTVKLETITPADAKKILENVHPRQTGRNSETTIKQYAKDMSKGFWDTSVPQMIAIDRKGRLLDGWHRLHAVTQSDVTVQFWVMRNADPDSFKKTDSGFARTMGFRMGTTTEEASLCNAVIRMACYPVSAGKTTVEQVMLASEYLGETYKTFLENTTRSTTKKLTQAPVKLAVLLNMKKYPASAKTICDAYTKLVNRDLTDAPRSMNTLKTKIEDENPTHWKLFAYAFKAFNPHGFHLSVFRSVDASEIVRQVQSEMLGDLPKVLF
jgi:hypothetical protein